jgi:hypothetical protein
MAGVSPRRERQAWIVAAVAVLLTVAVVSYQLGRGSLPAPTVADMGNAGNAGVTPGAQPTRAPDISQMTPRERFNRLWERVMRAVESQSSDTVLMFAPMALGAYSQLDTFDTDARFHAALIHLAVGEWAEAKALADTITTTDKTHLFAFVIRGNAADQQNDSAALRQAFRDFLANHDNEMRANRKEYNDHKSVIDDFAARARATTK